MNKDVKFAAPACLDEALALLADNGKKVTVLAGGTDVAAAINSYKLQPDLIMYIGNLGLDYIKEEEDCLVLGAMVTLTQVIDSEILKEKATALVDAARQSSSSAIHSVATVGGNIMNKSPAGDCIAALYALGAEVVLASIEGERAVKIGDFFTGYKQTVCQDNEMVKEIRLPKKCGKSAYVKLGKRKAQTLAVVAAGAYVCMEGDIVKDICVSIGSMAPTVICACDDFACMIDKAFSPELVAQAAEAAIAKTNPIDDSRATAWYRKSVGASIVKRAVYAAAGVEYAE